MMANLLIFIVVLMKIVVVTITAVPRKESAGDDGISSSSSSAVFKTQPYPSPSAFSRRGIARNRQTSPVLRAASNNKDKEKKEAAPSMPSPSPSPAVPSTLTPLHQFSTLSTSSATMLPVVAHIKMDIDSTSFKIWSPKWWGCNSNTALDQPTTTPQPISLMPPSEDSAAGAEELFISSQIENLVLKAHIAIRAELLTATTISYPPSSENNNGEEESISSPEQIWIKAEFKVLELFRFSDLRGKGKPFLDAYTTNGRIAVSFRQSPALIASGMMENSECFSSMLSPQQSPSSPSVVVMQNNMLRKRNIKAGLTYLLFIAITSSSSSSSSSNTTAVSIASPISVPLTNGNNKDGDLATGIDLVTPSSSLLSSPSLPMSQQLHYSLMAPPMVFHKRFRHSIYNVLCTDCTNAPLIKQLSIKFNASQGVLSAYCVSPAHPIPAFTWILDGVELKENNDDGTLLETKFKVDRIRTSRKNTKLDVSSIEENRAHTLICSAQNHFGQATLSQTFAIQGNKMSMLLLRDEHDRALNLSDQGVIYDGDYYATTPFTSLMCLGNFGRQVMDWAFLNPWISVFIGLACVILFLAIALLILKCILRARFHSLSRHSSSKCPHHGHHRHHERSPSFNAGTIVIDSSCNGDDCITTSAGSARNYMTAESKVPLLGKSNRGENPLPRRHNGNNNHHSHGLAVMVGNETPPTDGSSSEGRRGASPGSDGGSSSGPENHHGKHGPLAASSNSTASSSAGAVSLTAPQRGSGNNTANNGGSMTPNSNARMMSQQPQQVHATFRTLQGRPQGPPTAPRPNPAMTQSWHAQMPDPSQHNYSQIQHYTVPPEIPPQTYLYGITAQQPIPPAALLIRQAPPPPPPPEPEKDVIVKLLPALSAASSLAEFLGHENEHIEVVPEANEEYSGSSDDDAPQMATRDDDGPVASIDSDEEIDRRRSDRRQFLNVLEQVDNDIIDNNIVIPNSASAFSNQQQSLSLSDSLTSNDNKHTPPQQQQPQQSYNNNNNNIMSSSQSTAIYRPLQTISAEHYD